MKRIISAIHPDRFPDKHIKQVNNQAVAQLTNLLNTDKDRLVPFKFTCFAPDARQISHEVPQQGNLNLRLQSEAEKYKASILVLSEKVTREKVDWAVEFPRIEKQGKEAAENFEELVKMTERSQRKREFHSRLKVSLLRAEDGLSFKKHR